MMPLFVFIISFLTCIMGTGRHELYFMCCQAHFADFCLCRNRPYIVFGRCGRNFVYTLCEFLFLNVPMRHRGVNFTLFE